MDLKIIISKDKLVFETAAKIRSQVFVDEQGFSYEFDELDDTSYHAVIYDGDTPIGCARFYSDKLGGHIGRVAVIPEYRGKNIGTYIMNELEKFGLKQGVSELIISAQTRASGFYKSCGFSEVGEEYLDEFCPHIEMRKQIK